MRDQGLRSTNIAHSKVAQLDEAVLEFVAPGQQIHFSFTHNRSHVLASEVARQLRGTESLDLVGTGLLEYAAVLSAAGTLRTASSAFAGSTFPYPGRSRTLAEWLPDAGDPHGTNLTL